MWAGLVTLVAGPVRAECPSPEIILETVAGHDLSKTSRIDRFGKEMPAEIHRKAAARPGRPAAARDGIDGFGAIVVALPVERMWKAISDEDHFDLEGFLPVKRSDVIEGDPRGPRRRLLQTFDRFGIGRWWVSDVFVNVELFEESGGSLWEVYWHDRMSEVDPSAPPMNEVSSSLTPLVESHGVWLLVPVADECTLVDYYVHADPGGVIGALQRLMLKGAIRSTLEGIVRMAEEHMEVVHSGERFLRPDGRPLR